ncbi:unnamed protein product, partial [Closterium sp. Naga37s-1]
MFPPTLQVCVSRWGASGIEGREWEGREPCACCIAGGGSGRHQPPPLSPPLCYDTHSAVPACRLVVDLGMLGVMLHQQPMMPITFYSSPPGVSKSMSQELMEEEITAFTLGMALHDPSTPEWSIYMPMAKSLVRALDATQLAARELLPHVPSYTDPYFFRERLTMPKLLIAASNDEFFLMDDSYFYYNGLPPPTLLKFVANVDHMVIQKSYWAYDAAISFLSSLLHVNSSCASLPASSRPSLTWTRPTTPTPAALIPHTTSSSPDPTPSQTPHSSQPSSLTDAEAAAVGAAVGAAVAEAQNPPWKCVPDLPAVDWPRLRWQFDWPTFTIHATSDRKPLAVRAWTGRTRPGSKRRDFRFIVKQGLTGCTVPFKSAPGSYTAKFGTLCVQPIPFLLHTVSPPALQPDKLWYFNSSIRDIPK